ncbi:MAG: beta-ketoacyl synthase N-terminal-like domain-containing protein [Pseudomonadales bacterium]
MSDVFIIGVGQTPVGKKQDLSLADMGASAVIEALAYSQIEPEKVTAFYAGNMMSGQLCNQQLVATLIANKAGLTGCEAITAEGACGSGGAAARLGFMAIASGCHEAVVVCGAEKMTHSEREDTTAALATASHWDTEGGKGETFLSLNAKVMDLYMDHYQLSQSSFANFSVNAHKNAMTNPNAMLRKQLGHDDYDASRSICGPIRLMDAPPICDGAAAIILGNLNVAIAAQEKGIPVVRISASAVASDHLALADRESLLKLSAAEVSAHRAYRQSGLTPADIDLFEPHDAYTIMTALSLEACGFAAPGTATELSEEDIGLNGNLPICTFGGLKARGHPVGATGIYQLVECFMQLTDTAGENQVYGARIGMTQNFAGAAAVVFTHILERCENLAAGHIAA